MTEVKWKEDENIIRHITKQDELQQLALDLGVREDWHEPDEQDLTLEFSGKLFDNSGIWGHKVAIAPDSLEQYVTIRKKDMPVAEINMATLLAWASKPVEAPPTISENDRSSVDMVDAFNSPDFREFLHVRLCNPSTEEYVKIYPLTRTTAAVSAYDKEPVRKSWSIAQYFEKYNTILVSNPSGTHRYECMNYEEAIKVLHKMIYEEAENISSVSSLYDLLSRHININVSDLFKELNKQPNSAVNYYEVLRDMDQDPDIILAEAVDDLTNDISDDILISVAKTHLDLTQEELLEAAMDDSSNPLDSVLIDIAEDMNLNVPDSIRKILSI